MRVLIITKVFPNQADPNTAPFNLYQFAALAKLCEVEILALVPWFPGCGVEARLTGRPNPNRVPAVSHLMGIEATHPRVLYIPRVGRSLAGLTYTCSLLPYVAQRRRRVDVVLGAFAYPDGAAAVRIGKLLKAPTVIKVHGTDVNVYSQDRSLRPRLRAALSAATAVVGPSQALVDLAVTHGANPATAHVVHNGVDSARFRVRDRTECKQRLGRSPERPLLVFIGRLEPEKGVLDLLHAFEIVAAQRPDVDLVLVGSGVAEREYRRFVAERRLPVHFAGKCRADEVAEWLGAADVFTLPSWAEGTPNVVIEALASGRRVVATDVGGIPAVVRLPLLGELVPPKSPAPLARALTRALEAPYDAEAVRDGAALTDWDASAAKLHAVLLDAATSAARPDLGPPRSVGHRNEVHARTAKLLRRVLGEFGSYR